MGKDKINIRGNSGRARHKIGLNLTDAAFIMKDIRLFII